MRRDIRLLVLGDGNKCLRACTSHIVTLIEGVGKTSVITALLTEAFTEDVPHVLPEICIPPSISPDNVNTVIVDTSGK